MPLNRITELKEALRVGAIGAKPDRKKANGQDNRQVEEICRDLLARIEKFEANNDPKKTDARIEKIIKEFSEFFSKEDTLKQLDYQLLTTSREAGAMTGSITANELREALGSLPKLELSARTAPKEKPSATPYQPYHASISPAIHGESSAVSHSSQHYILKSILHSPLPPPPSPIKGRDLKVNIAKSGVETSAENTINKLKAILKAESQSTDPTVVKNVKDLQGDLDQLLTTKDQGKALELINSIVEKASKISLIRIDKDFKSFGVDINRLAKGLKMIVENSRVTLKDEEKENFRKANPLYQAGPQKESPHYASVNFNRGPKGSQRKAVYSQVGYVAPKPLLKEMSEDPRPNTSRPGARMR